MEIIPMTTETIQSVDLHFPLLTEAAYLAAVQKAETAIRDRVQAPTMDRYTKASTSAYPRWFMGGIIAALLAVLTFSFVISAGKQAAAMGLLVDHLPGKFNHLSDLWAGTSIVAMLLLSELGAVLFLVAGGTLAHTANLSQIGRWQVNVTRWIFTCFAVSCAGYAILSNITIAALDPVPSAAVLEWAISIGVPLIVLGLGVMLERMVIDLLKASAKQKVAYNMAVSDYEAVQADPTKHTSWASVLSDCLWAALNLRHKETISAYTERDARYRRWIVQSEYAAHQETAMLALEDGNPFLLPSGNSLPG
jgi:hypothetical protein